MAVALAGNLGDIAVAAGRGDGLPALRGAAGVVAASWIAMGA